MLSPLLGQILGAAEFLGLPRSNLSEPSSFSFEDLKTLAQTLAQRAYRAPQIGDSEVLEQIDYDEYQKIRYRPERALHLDSEARFPVELFHLGKYARDPVRISIVDEGQARELLYKSDLFDIPLGHPAKKLSENVGFAGFRIMDGALKTDWFSAIGASYFRSSGPFNQYGLSARGIAINTASPAPEEFPKFVHFWLEPAPGRDAPMTIYALLDGPSIAGAYKIEVQRAPNRSGLQNTLMTVETALYLRSDVERVGIAPFSSMFWYGKAVVRPPRDWRPEIHDTDGLAILNGNGERIWRPLRNPTHIMTNAFVDRNPRGFGLLQRDRDFDHYLDDGVFYEKRPSVWVEPIGDWGDGAVHLVEMPTGEETWDNVVAYWFAAGLKKSGQAQTFKYKLKWLDDIDFPESLGRTIGTWTGIGGPPGLSFSERKASNVKVVVDFEGTCFLGLTRIDGVELIVTSSRGTVTNASNYPVVGKPGRWRVLFDVEARGADPVDLRTYLKLGDRALTETWLYQIDPLTS